MELARRTRWIAFALPVALAAGAALARPAPPGVVAAVPGQLATCPTGSAQPVAGDARGAAPAWYRLDAVLDQSGTLAAQRLTAGHGSSRWSVDLPPESFASGPVGGHVLVGDDDGARSRLRLLDTRRACWEDIGAVADVVRSAVLAPDGARLFEHRVARSGRRDLGVWRRDPGAEAATAVSVLPGLAADAAAGPTFTTSLLAAADGRLVAASCGLRGCRTRILDPATGGVARVDGKGSAAGLSGSRLVALEACDGLPCELEAIDLVSGATTAIDEAAGAAVVASGSGGLIVLADDAGLGVARLGTTTDTELPGTAGLAPIGAASTADSGIEAPTGLVAVGPGGRIDRPSDVRFLDPASLILSAGEVLP